jgi:hypothetical protein
MQDVIVLTRVGGAATPGTVVFAQTAFNGDVLWACLLVARSSRYSLTTAIGVSNAPS